ELDRVLGSPVFRASRRCQILLRSIAEHSIAGDVESVRERALGVAVFGRPHDYDTSQDPVVRASAAEVRKKLAQYYQEAGHESEIRIELPPGSYLAEFHFRPEIRAVPIVHPRRRNRLAIVATAIFSVLLIVAGVVF